MYTQGSYSRDIQFFQAVIDQIHFNKKNRCILLILFHHDIDSQWIVNGLIPDSILLVQCMHRVEAALSYLFKRPTHLGFLLNLFPSSTLPPYSYFDPVHPVIPRSLTQIHRFYLRRHVPTSHTPLPNQDGSREGPGGETPRESSLSSTQECHSLVSLVSFVQQEGKVRINNHVYKTQ